jgi:protein arginine N-methyltransferase 5
MAERIVFGYRSPHVGDINDTINAADMADHKAEFVVVPLFHNRLRREPSTSPVLRTGPRTRSDRELSCRDWSMKVLGEISSWIDLCSPDKALASAAECAFKEEVAWASHLSLQAVLCPMPRYTVVGQVSNYARCLQQCFPMSPYMQYWIRIPILKPLISSKSGAPGQFDESDDGWQLWNHLRTLSGHSHRVAVALELSNDLPQRNDDGTEREYDFDMAAVCRWCAEIVKAVIIPTHIFLTNKRGFPVLSKSMQSVMNLLLKSKIHVIFTGKPSHSTPDTGIPSYAPYTQYLQFLRTKLRELMSEEEKSMQPYNDTLQSPLQPLMDNLEAQTYETFERDTIKYTQYEAAIAAALVELKSTRVEVLRQRHDCSDSDEDVLPPVDEPSACFVITVVGAGPKATLRIFDR